MPGSGRPVTQPGPDLSPGLHGVTPQWGRGGGTALPRGAHTLCSEHWGGRGRGGHPVPIHPASQGKGNAAIKHSDCFFFSFFLVMIQSFKFTVKEGRMVLHSLSDGGVP